MVKTSEAVNSESLERLIPESLEQGVSTGSETLKIHLERYDFAKKNVIGGRILDMACGVGYGSRYVIEKLQDRIDEIVAVDISESAIAYGQKNYEHPKIRFLMGDALTFTSEEKFDTIISLETLEHVDRPQDLIRNFRSLLKEKGILVVSAPVTPSVDINPYHCVDFTEKSFLKIFHDFGFTEQDRLYQVQSFNPFTILSKKEKRTSDLRKNLLSYYLCHPSKLLARIISTLRYGFSNRYLTVAWKVSHTETRNASEN